MESATTNVVQQQLASTVHMVRHETITPSQSTVAHIVANTKRQFFKEFYELDLPGVAGLVVRHSELPDEKPSFELSGRADVYMAYTVDHNVDVTVNGKTHRAKTVFLPFVCFVFHGTDETKRHYWMNDPSKNDKYMFEWNNGDGSIVRASIKRSLRVIFESYAREFPALTKCILDGPYAQVGDEGCKQIYLRVWDELHIDYVEIRKSILAELL